jgi:hypothetical protein
VTSVWQAIDEVLEPLLPEPDVAEPVPLVEPELPEPVEMAPPELAVPFPAPEHAMPCNPATAARMTEPRKVECSHHALSLIFTYPSTKEECTTNGCRRNYRGFDSARVAAR